MSLTFTYTGTDFPPDLQAPGRRRRQPLRPTVLGREAPVGPRSRRAGFLAKLVSHCFSVPGNGSERPWLPITDVCLKRVLNVAWTVSTGGESRAFGFSESERRVRGLRWLEACGRVGQDAACTADSQTLPPAALPATRRPARAPPSASPVSGRRVHSAPRTRGWRGWAGRVGLARVRSSLAGQSTSSSSAARLRCVYENTPWATS